MTQLHGDGMNMMLYIRSYMRDAILAIRIFTIKIMKTMSDDIAP
jgi:hypothetical protein